MIRYLSTFLTILLGTLAMPLAAVEPEEFNDRLPTAPRIEIEPVPAWADPIGVSVWTDQTSYQVGADVTIYVRPTQDSYLYVFSTDSRGITRQLFPNGYDNNNFTRANQQVVLPSRNYRLVASGSGWDTIHAVAVGAQGGWRAPSMFNGYSTSEPFPRISGGVDKAREELLNSMPRGGYVGYGVPGDGDDERNSFSNELPGRNDRFENELPREQQRQLDRIREENQRRAEELRREFERNREETRDRIRDQYNHNNDFHSRFHGDYRYGFRDDNYRYRNDTLVLPPDIYYYQPSRRYIRPGFGEAWTQIYVHPRGSSGYRPPIYNPGFPDRPPYGDREKDGTLRVTSSPTRADVYIENVYYGRTPVEVELPEGRYEVEVYKPGYEVWTDVLSVTKDKTTSTNMRLKARR